MDWKTRFKNPLFWVQILLAILTPILAYAGLTAKDITTWGRLFDLLGSAISNPYVLSLVAVSVFNAITNPTTKGITDNDNSNNKENK